MEMDKINAGDPLSRSKDLLSENISKLKELFPEVVTEGNIDFKALQEVLGEEVEEGEEYYRFTWAGKAQARREAHKPSTGTLRPAKEESVAWDTTQNLYIEGDNLEVLKLMQKSYTGKVKMIYIDPPYNTGKDFVYKDNYKDNLKNYQKFTGLMDEEGNQYSTNSESDGRYHSNWLNMMYPRLILARNLLADDGVIFMSIDDNEVENLKKLGDEIFGSANFIANLVWERAYSPKNDAKYISNSHDYILAYAKTIDSFEIGRLERTKEADARYQNPDDDPRGVWKSSDMSVKTYNEACDYPIKTPSGRTIEPPAGRCWRLSKKAFLERLQDNRIWFGKDGNSVPSIKRFLTELRFSGMAPTSILFYKDVGHSQEGAKEVVSLFEGKGHFDGPKPVRLLQRLLKIANTEKDSIILDFFSGSASTAHAVMKVNAQDDGNRKHIQVQLPEPTDEKSEAYKAGYKTIAEIGKERIRRAGKKIAEEYPEKAKDLDLGFKVFKLDSSNIKAWDGNPENLEENLFAAQENIKPERKEEDVLYEILLKSGLDLSLPIEEKTLDKQVVYNIGGGALFICLGDTISTEVAEGIGKWKEELQPGFCRVVFKDSGLSDVEKTNSIQILKRYGIEEVRSI